MKTIGITGQNGFIGYHLVNTLKLISDKFEVIDFKRSYFWDDILLDSFVRKCDIIVHLAGINRHDDQIDLYNINIQLANNLKSALVRTGSKPHVIFASSTQELTNSIYGRSKKDARRILFEWSKSSGSTFTGILIPNIFGPFCKPFSNSFVSTFCHQLVTRDKPLVIQDSEVSLLYVDDLIQCILNVIHNGVNENALITNPTDKYLVSDVLEMLNSFKELYYDRLIIPSFSNKFQLNLFNTFRSFIDYSKFFPIKYKQNFDDRGSFTELIKLNSGGQISFSVTRNDVIRGNHFHTRKIERFSVIKGSALVMMRQVGTSDVLKLILDGSAPSFVDIPVWYSHSIKNIGSDDLYTVFWISEHYSLETHDTYNETVSNE